MALNLTATGQRLSIASAVITAYPFTLAAWVWPSSLTASRGVLCIYSGTGASGVDLYLTTAAKVVADVGGTGSATTTAVLDTTKWWHVAGVYTSNTSRAVYLNGANKVSSAVSGSLTTVNTSNIGSIFQASSQFDMVGQIAFPAFWSAALSDSDIASLAAGISPLKIRPDVLASFQRLLGVNPEPDMRANRTWPYTGAPVYASNPPIFMP